MGPNGSGKTTLAQVLAGRDEYEVTEGQVLYKGQDLLEMAPEERAARGRLPRLPVSGRDPRRLQHLLPEGGAQRQAQAPGRAGARRDRLPEAGAREGEARRAWTSRSSSGRSTKASRAARRSATRSSTWRSSSPSSASSTRPTPASTSTPCGSSPTASTRCAAKDRAFVVITHYQRLLNYIVPDFVHVLLDGRIVRSGGKELALELEEKGYAWLGERSRGRAA